MLCIVGEVKVAQCDGEGKIFDQGGCANLLARCCATSARGMSAEKNGRTWAAELVTQGLTSEPAINKLFILGASVV